MKNWTTVFLYELQRSAKRKAYLFTTFGLPLIAVILFAGYIAIIGSNDEDEESIEDTLVELEESDPVGFVDESGFFKAPDSESSFNGYIQQFEDFESGKKALENEDVSSLYVIEADYLETGTITQWQTAFKFNNLDHDVFDAFLLNQLTTGVERSVALRLQFPTANLVEKRIDKASNEAVAGNEDRDFWVVYLFAIAYMISTYSSSGYLMQSVVEEKESKTIEIILTSVKPVPLLLGKTLAMGLLGLFQMGLWVVTLFLLADQASVQIVDFESLEVSPTVIVIALAYFMLGYGFLGGIFAAMGAIANTTREGSSLAGWATFPTFIPLFVIAAIVDDPNGTLSVVLSIVPFTAPITMVMRSVITTIPLVQVVASLGSMLLLVMFSIWLAGRLFRVGSLLSGTTPKIRELPGLILRG